MRRRVNVWGNLISMHLEPNESEPNAFEGRADSSIDFFMFHFQAFCYLYIFYVCIIITIALRSYAILVLKLIADK